MTGGTASEYWYTTVLTAQYFVKIITIGYTYRSVIYVVTKVPPNLKYSASSGQRPIH